jgi:hypothetical protein
MSPWARVAVAIAAIVLAAVLLKLLPPVVVLVVVFGGFWYVAYRLRRREADGRAAGAELLGLKRETADPFGLLSLPMELFSRVPEGAVEDLVWGTWRGLEVRVFGLSFRGPALDPDAASRERFGVAMASLSHDVPATVFEPQVFLTWLSGAPPLERVDTGDEAFDAAWSAWAADRASALALADDDGRSWLRSLDDAWGVEVNGRAAVVYGPAPHRPDVVTVLEILRDLIARASQDAPGADRPHARTEPDEGSVRP